MRLFHAPGSCSLGIRILLEEIGAPYDLAVIDLAAGAQRNPSYLAINSKGKVPALERDDGTVLTEFQAIALWLSRRFPAAGLWPTDLEGEVRMLELLEFLVGTVHMRGFTLALVPGKFVPDHDGQDALRAHGLGVAIDGLARIAERLDGASFLNGVRPGVADAALFYLLKWAVMIDLPLPPILSEFHDRMMRRSAVHRALDPGTA
jgi:glutathione S-transferase